MKLSMIMGTVGLLASLGSAEAGPSLSIEARMFMRDSGKVDDDLFAKDARPTVNVLDYGVLADEVMIVIKVPDGLGPKLSVTVKQGKKTIKKSWKVNVGSAFGIETGHYPVLVEHDDCNPMTITATIGKTSTTSVIAFNCAE